MTIPTDYTDVLLDALNELDEYTSEHDYLTFLDERLHEEIDANLIYTSDIIDVWDGETHDNVDFRDADSISDLITESVYWQLRYSNEIAKYDALDMFLDAKHSATGCTELHYDRDETIDCINPQD